MSRRLRTLLFSTLYPSSVRPGHGIFVETRLRELLGSGEIETKVVAPVPWFPSANPRYGDYALFAKTPRREERHGVEVLHPRYLLLPKVGMTLAPLTLALGAAPAVRQLLAEGFDFDVIDAHYYYPDGVAAALLARWFDKPFTVTARGTDLNLIPDHRLPRRMIQWAARKADASIGVCAALIDVLRQWKIDPKRLHVMRNGVDLNRFRPLPMQQMRRELGLSGGPVLLSVGHLVERKGHHLVIDALAALTAKHSNACLVIAGDGPERKRLQQQALARGLAERIVFAGNVPNADLARWYSAADVLILASSREGWANVLLEAMACGTPVVATRIWGTPEVVAPEVGRLVDHRDGASIAQALEALLADSPDRATVRRYAEGFSWDATTRAQLALFKTLVPGSGSA
ncbi:glycosyltransferase family 4 protein [soil metagenome]